MIFANNFYTKLKQQTEKEVLNKKGVFLEFQIYIITSQKKTQLLKKIFNKLIMNKNLKIQNPYPIRDFLWLEDLLDAIVLYIILKPRGIFNVSTSVGTSIGDLLNQGLKLKGLSTINFKKNDNYFSQLILDNTKIKKELGWIPKISINSGLTLMLKN